MAQTVKNAPAMQELFCTVLSHSITSSSLQPCGLFPGSSAGKESTCNVGDLGQIPG